MDTKLISSEGVEESLDIEPLNSEYFIKAADIYGPSIIGEVGNLG